MDPKNKTGDKSAKKTVRTQNVLESLKDIGGSAGQSFNRDLVQGTSKDFLKQIMGANYAPRKVSGELRPGESMDMDKAYSGEHERLVKENRQLHFLNRLKDEETRMVSEKSDELKIKLNALQQELLGLVQTTGELAEETQVAAMTVTVEPGVYHLSFIEQLIEFVKSFRRQIGGAGVWMGESNKRAQKKNFWGKYKENGSKFLLSADHYLTRSAG